MQEIRILCAQVFSSVYWMNMYLDVDSQTDGVKSYFQQQNERS